MEITGVQRCRGDLTRLSMAMDLAPLISVQKFRAKIRLHSVSHSFELEIRCVVQEKKKVTYHFFDTESASDSRDVDLPPLKWVNTMAKSVRIFGVVSVLFF